MGNDAPRRIHTVTAGYLRRFARDGVVTVRHAKHGTYKASPKRVACQYDFWGPEDLAREVEESFGRNESAALRTMRKVSERWPPVGPNRAHLAGFMAIHIVRTPAYGSFVRSLGEEAIREQIEASDFSPAVRAAATDEFRGPRMHATTLLGQITRIGSLLGSMQWTLVQFERDLLTTCDQPVVLLPLGGGDISPASSLAPFGLANTMEVRFTLDPRQVLLLTWLDGRDAEQPLEGTYAQACSVNCGVAAQAVEEWVHRPGTTPPFHSPPLLRPRLYPISTELLSGYTHEAAVRSERRAATDALMTRLIDENAPRDRMEWVRVADAA